MEEEIKKQEKALAEAVPRAKTESGHSGMYGVVNVINRATQAVLLVARILDRWSTEEYSRSEAGIERRAR